MIKYMKIENFKSLRNTSLVLAPLNLFFGINGMGKSSVIQTLLLLRQSYFKNGNLDRLYTNGILASLGTGKDILCQSADKDSVRFYIKGQESVLDCRYRCDSSSLQNDVLERIGLPNAGESFQSPLFSDGFAYLSAEHLGPRKIYDTENARNGSCSRFGVAGDYVVPFLAMQGNSLRVPKGLCRREGRTDLLIDQASAWMSAISPGAKVMAELVPAMEKAKLTFSYQGKVLSSDPYLPVNVGFGIPYSLPLIVELLLASKGSLILLENPESHLHPKGQAVIARLIAAAVAQGAQIVCESHSDHIINSIRVAVKEKALHPEDVAVSYFSTNGDNESVVNPVEIDGNGELSDYPSGLLDEWGDLLSRLL